MKNFDIQLSEAFLAKFPPEEREIAAARTKYVMYLLMLNKDSDEINRALNSSIEFFDPHAVALFGKTDSESEWPPITTYFDPHAIIYIEKGPRQYHTFPAITAISFNDSLKMDHWYQLLDAVAEYPGANGEGGDGSFLSPLVCAIVNRHWEAAATFSDNPNINPNEIIPNFSDTHYSHVLPVQGDCLLPNSNNQVRVGPDGCTALDTLFQICEEDSRKPGMLDPFFIDWPMSDVIKKYINNGGRLTHFSYALLDNPAFKDVRNHIEYAKKELALLDAEDCTVGDFRQAFALNQLAPWFQKAQDDVEARANLLKIRDEIPQWMRDELAPAYDILEAETWAARTDERQDRGIA